MLRDQLKLHFIVLLWGFTSILGVLISIPSVEIVFYRTMLASIGLALLAFGLKKKLSISKRGFLKIFLTGFLVSAHWILFFTSVKISKISICLAGVATTALFTAILEPIFNRTKIKFYEIILGVMVIIGLYIIFQFEYDHFWGLTFALGAALLASIFTIFNSWFAKIYDSTVVSFYELSGAFIFSALFLPFYQVLLAENGKLSLIPNTSDWFYLGFLALVCTVYAFYASVELLQKISAFNFNLIVNMEPIYGIILAFIFFSEREQMTTGFYIGAFIILLSVLIYPILDRWFKPKLIQNK